MTPTFSRQVDVNLASEFAEEKRLLFLEVSALNAQKVDQAFELAIKQIIETAKVIPENKN